MKNRRNIAEIKAFGSYQTLRLTESLGFLNQPHRQAAKH